MGTVKSLIRIIIITTAVTFVKLPVQAAPVVTHQEAQDRILKPPTFPYGNVPHGYTSSAIFCPWLGTPWVGGWFGRSCAGPVPPFKLPTSTTTAKPSTDVTPKPMTNYYNYGYYGGIMPMGHHNVYEAQEQDEDGVEGNPWEPDDEEIFLENNGGSSHNPNYKFGDPNQ